MKIWNLFATGVFAAVVMIAAPAAQAQEDVTQEEMPQADAQPVEEQAADEQAAPQPQQQIDPVVGDIINRTLYGAQQEIQKNTRIDILDRGYSLHRRYTSQKGRLSAELEQDMLALGAEHDSNIMQLYADLQVQLAAGLEAFNSDDSIGTTLMEKRAAFQRGAEVAYGAFTQGIADENARAEGIRNAIIRQK